MWFSALDPTFEIFSLKSGEILVGDQRPQSGVSSSLAGKVECSEKFPYFVSQRNEGTLEFAWKRNSVSCMLGDVTRFTKSVNFTFPITVGNLSAAKIQFWLVAKQK